ncbi:MAG: SDR family NAD(P)-dependent oxidoreductase [Dehalococcoidia bacterium]
MELGLKGKKVIVTGGSRGLGKAIAESLAKEGAKVAICARDANGVSAALADFKAKGLDVTGEAMAVGDTDEYENWVKATAERLGGLDIFVSNTSAGGDGSRKGWKSHFEVDVMGAVRGVDAALPFLEKGKTPNVLIINTTAAVEAFPPPPATGMGGYGPMKAALLNYANAASQALAAKGIRVNSISPGPTYFEGGPWAMVEKAMPPFFDMIKKGEPMGRLGAASDVSNAATFLVSEAASFITGVNLVVDGGFTRRVAF